jgi:NADPH-dependent curcumin reductase CurA
VRGSITLDYWDRFAECSAQLSAWPTKVACGGASRSSTGLEHAPEALNMLFTAGNTGKVIVAVSPE